MNIEPSTLLPTFVDGPVQVDLLMGRRATLDAHALIDSFRSQTPQRNDPLTAIDHHVDWAGIRNGVPIAALVSRSGHLFGIVLFCLRRKFGLSIGLASAGTAAGEASVIADIGDRRVVVEAACKAMINAPLIHTVLCSVQWNGDVEPGTIRPIPDIKGHWHFRETRTRLSLQDGVDGVMGRLGYKMRRNMRSYRRRAEAGLGCRFLPGLSDAQRREAVIALHDRDIYTLATAPALRQEAVLSRLPGAFAVGVQDSRGKWLSYIAGWRKADETHVMWQLNEAKLDRFSMSTTMRSYLLEHEAERGSSALVFVGGTSTFWANACEPTTCGDLLVLSGGPMGTVARRLSGLVSPSGQISKLHTQLNTTVQA